jgi:hypothetical protein
MASIRKSSGGNVLKVNRMVSALRVYPLAARFSRRNLWACAGYSEGEWSGIYCEVSMN